MIKVILIYLLIIGISILVGFSIRLDWDKSSLYKGTNIEDISPDKECEDGICPLPEEYKDGNDR